MGHRPGRSGGLRGGTPVRGESPWWQAQAERVSELLAGTVLTAEALALRIPDYPNGKRPRPMTAVRRLARVLELVSRGPNRSLSRGATYRVLRLPPRVEPLGAGAPDDESLPVDRTYIDAALERITGKGKK